MLAHARATGAADLPQHTIDELAAHLEDIYLEALRPGRSEADAYRAATAALAESPLAIVPRVADARARVAPGQRGAGGTRADGLGRRLPVRVAAVAPRAVVCGDRHRSRSASAPAPRPRSSASSTPCCCGRCRSASREQLVAIWETNAEKALPKETPVARQLHGLSRHAAPPSPDAAAWWRPEVNLAEPGLEPVRVSTIETSANLFQVLGVSPQLGPGFPQDGPFYSRDQIAVISDRLWRQRYNADPGDRRHAC